MMPLVHGADARAGFDARDQTVDRDADAIDGAPKRAVDATGARADALVEEIFDKRLRFVLDIKNFSSIIYIWYEGGQLRPALVRLSRVRPRSFRGGRRAEPEFRFPKTMRQRKVHRSDERRFRASVPGGSRTES